MAAPAQTERSRARATPDDDDSYHPDIEWEVNEKTERLKRINSNFPTRIRLIEMLTVDLRDDPVDSYILLDAIQMLAEDLADGHSQARGIRAVLPGLKAALAQQNAAE